MLALCLTQLLPLPHDSWAILSVLVVMLSQYVGAAAVKAIMRVVGTIAGDDTVLIVCEDARHATDVESRLRAILES